MEFVQEPITVDSQARTSFVALTKEPMTAQVIPLKGGVIPPPIDISVRRHIADTARNEATPLLVATFHGELYELNPVWYGLSAFSLATHRPVCVTGAPFETKGVGVSAGFAWATKPREYAIVRQSESQISVKNLTSGPMVISFATAGTTLPAPVTAGAGQSLTFAISPSTIHYMLYTGAAFNAAHVLIVKDMLVVLNRLHCAYPYMRVSAGLSACHDNTASARLSIDGINFEYSSPVGLLASVNEGAVSAYCVNGTDPLENATLTLSTAKQRVVANAANASAIEAFVRVNANLYRIVAVNFRRKGEDFPMLFGANLT